MPVVHIASSDGKKTQKAAYKRRRDQNSEIGELGALLPWSQKGTGIDKISILRLTTAYMRFKNFWQSSYLDDPQDKAPKKAVGFERLFSEALEGFILIISPSGEVIFVSEGISDLVGITQQEVIGQSIYELTHEDDHESIQKNLAPEGVSLQQMRHFYIRFKSSITPGKKQLSKFGGTVMLQVSGKLKLSPGKTGEKPTVVGLVAECKRIESSFSLLELQIPQVSFTSTTSMDLKILSVDTKMKMITGFNSDVEGSNITNFFHPADNRRSIHCLKTLLITGQARSPIVRFMTHTGEWVWVQIEGLVRYEADNRTPKYLEAVFKVICASDNGVKLIEQKELYGKVADIGDSNDGGIHADPRFNIPSQCTDITPESIVKSFESTNVSEAVRDVLLHGREEVLSSIPLNMDRLATWNEVMDAVVEYETSKGLKANYNTPYPLPEEGSTSTILPSNLSSSGTPSPVAESVLSSASSPSSVPFSPPEAISPPIAANMAYSSVPITAYSPPTVPVTAYSPPIVPVTAYSPPIVPVTAYSPPTVPVTAYSPPTVPATSYSPPTAPGTAYSPPTVPVTAYSPPTVPVTAYSPPTAPGTAYSPPTVPVIAYSPPTVPVTAYSLSTVPYSPHIVPVSSVSTSPSPTNGIISGNSPNELLMDPPSSVADTTNVVQTNPNIYGDQFINNSLVHYPQYAHVRPIMQQPSNSVPYMGLPYSDNGLLPFSNGSYAASNMIPYLPQMHIPNPHAKTTIYPCNFNGTLEINSFTGPPSFDQSQNNNLHSMNQNILNYKLM